MKWLTELFSWLRFKSVNIDLTNTYIAICKNCGAENRIPINTFPYAYRCGHCHLQTLDFKPSTPKSDTGTILTTSAAGTAIGALFGGPPGAVIGGVAGAILGATGMFNKPKQ